METTTYVLLRLGIGASLFGHGLVRLPKLNTFSNWMIGSFEKSILPKILTIPFSYALPIAEFAIGLLLLLGLFTRQSATEGGIELLEMNCIIVPFECPSIIFSSACWGVITARSDLSKK